MRLLDNNHLAFLTLVQAGLWEKDVQLALYGKIDFSVIHKLAEEQSVVGLVTAGLDHVKDIKVPQDWTRHFIGETLQVEQRNKAMNEFSATMVEKMRGKDIYALLVKGQGVAQCYEKPLWRPSGDIDFFFYSEGYNKAVEFFLAQENARQVQNAQYTKSFGVVIEPWFIELHGTMRNGLSTKMDKEIDAVQRDLFYGGNVRSWMNGKTQVFLPDATNDVFLVFVHFVRHFYKEGVNLRQLCDWGRLIWAYRSELDVKFLEKRIERSGLMGEWKAFAAVVVDYLGMDVNVMPLYEDRGRLKRKAERIMEIILLGCSGNKVRDTFEIAKVFPRNTMKFMPGIMWHVNWLKIRERFFFTII